MKQGELFGGDDVDAPRAARPAAKKRTAAKETASERSASDAEDAAADAPAAKPIPDAADRALAVTTFDRPLLLEAGAGTGKTATLVARVLAWALGPGWTWKGEGGASGREAHEDVAVRVLRGVVAITFTEAAAAEMSTRVGQALARVERATTNGVLDEKELPLGLPLELLPQDVNELHARARALRAALDNLNVSTIHAFCRRLLSAHPLEVGFAPDFEVDATGSLTRAVVRDVLEEHLRDAWTDPIDPDLLFLARKRKAPPEIEEAVHVLLDAGARAEDLANDPLDAGTRDALVQGVRDALGPLFELVAEPLSAAPARQKTHDALDALRATFTALEADADDDEDAEQAFLALSSRLREPWSDRALSKLKEWAKDGTNKTEGKLVEAIPGFSEALIERATALRAAIEPLATLDPAFLGAARRALHPILARIETELARRGVATFNDLLSGAASLLTRHPAIARRERARIDQLLVDEFQDTDGLQCEIVQALALDGPEDERPALFLVGDPKQSIFAWRNADLAAYDALATRVRDAGGRVLELTCNFRSIPEVLDEVARSIEGVMVPEPGVQPPFLALTAYRDAAGGAPIEHWVSWSRDDATGTIEPGDTRKDASYEVEAEALARDIRRRHGVDGLEWSSVGVIFRALTGIEPYLRALREHGIPYEVQSDRKYYQRREVIDVTALVRAVLDPNDLLALVTLLRSPYVGVPDAALLPLWEEGLPGKLARLSRANAETLDEIADAVRRAAARVPSEIPGIDRIRGWEASAIEAIRSLAAAREGYRRLSADRWIAELRARFLPDATEAARFLGAYRLANVERFFRELLRTLEERAGDTHAVLRVLRANLSRDDKTEASRPADSEQNAVQILTIHGAKGLEYRDVYLPQMHRSERQSKGDETVFDRRGGVTAYKLFSTPSPQFFATTTLREEAESAERVRLLYVAMTRARDRLVVIGGWRPDFKRKDWRQASGFADLLESREGADAMVTQLVGKAFENDATAALDAHGVRWRLAATIADSGGATETERAVVGTTPARARRDAELLRSLRDEARAHAARPFQSRASDHGDDTAVRAERRYAGGEAPEVARVSRDAAKLVGTAVHLVLERFRPRDGESVEVALERASTALEPALHDVEEREREDAVRRARDLLARTLENGLLARLAELDVVARELPVLLPAPIDRNATDAGALAPIGFVSGAIDLVYRDASGALVVADYKTDPVAPGRELDARVELYRAQGAAYVRAVREALSLEREPRFELWFLHAGSVVTA